MKKLTLVLLATLTFSCLQAQQIAGTWNGKLDLGAQQLGITFHFNKSANGSDSVTMDIPEQGATAIPVNVNLLNNDSLSIAIPAIAMSYSGRMVANTINGTFVQRGMSFPLNLTPGIPSRPNRPQEPKAPYGYTTEEVAFTNGTAGVILSGTLTYPVGYKHGSKTPVVIMVSGSGAQNRDEELFEHKPFLVLADHLAKNGIASLRYDDRGVGHSTGTQANCTTKDFADDTRAGIKWLNESKKFGKVGILGHSEGGLIAFMIAAENGADFIVSLAGPALKGDTLLAEQQNAILRTYGQPAGKTVETLRTEMAAMPVNTWMNYFINYNPAPEIVKINIPVFALNGSNDIQVIAESNLKLIKELLAYKNRKNQFKEYPGLNHLFQHCTPATALDYHNIEETISPEVLKDIADWINNL